MNCPLLVVQNILMTYSNEFLGDKLLVIILDTGRSGHLDGGNKNQLERIVVNKFLTSSCLGE